MLILPLSSLANRLKEDKINTTVFICAEIYLLIGLLLFGLMSCLSLSSMINAQMHTNGYSDSDSTRCLISLLGVLLFGCGFIAVAVAMMTVFKKWRRSKK